MCAARCAYCTSIFILNAPHGFIKLIRAKRQSACAYDANACVSAQLSSTNRLANTGRMHPTTANRLILWLMNWQRTNWRTQHFNALYVWQCKWETHTRTPLSANPCIASASHYSVFVVIHQVDLQFTGSERCSTTRRSVWCLLSRTAQAVLHARTSSAQPVECWNGANTRPCTFKPHPLLQCLRSSICEIGFSV